MILLEVATSKLSHFYELARRSKVLGPRCFKV